LQFTFLLDDGAGPKTSPALNLEAAQLIAGMQNGQRGDKSDMRLRGPTADAHARLMLLAGTARHDRIEASVAKPTR
jgi:hypothetical protein